MRERVAHTLITAHAGAEGTAPNTFESLRALVGCGADAIEVDVRADAEGALLLSHNPLVAEESYASLASALEWLAEHGDGMMVNIDLKEEDLVERVYAQAERCGMVERILFTGSVCPVDERFLRERVPEIWFNEFLLLPEERDTPLEAVLRRGHPAINIYYPRVNPATLTPDVARRYSVWTLDDPQAIAAFLRAGVRNITTRMPRQALALRAQIQGVPRI